jgi:hypothetical protein
MVGVDPGSAREEAERLVATALAAARLAASGPATDLAGPIGRLGEMISGVLGQPAGPEKAADGAGHGRFATGTPECCVCPICRAVAALRDPSPEFAERLATGAGDLAAGVASMLRAFAPAADPATVSADSSGSGTRSAATDTRYRTSGRSAPTTGSDGAPAPGPASPLSPPVDGWAPDDEVWRRTTRTGDDSRPAPEGDVWAAATRADAQAGPGGRVAYAEAAQPAPRSAASGPSGSVPGVPPAAKRPVVPASRAPREAADEDDVPGARA